MTKEEFIKYCKEQGYNLTDDQFYGKKMIDNLLLVSLTEIPEGFNPKVGGSLYLNLLTSIPEGFNPVVGGNLWLNRLNEIPENWNPTNIVWGIFINSDNETDIKPTLKFINFQI